VLDNHKFQVFTGPPENVREVVVAAALALAKGDWRKCSSMILELKVWNLVAKGDRVKAMLARKIQEEGLRTFLFTYAPVYDSISLIECSRMFELPEKAVHSVVSRMMINDELHASWDQPTGTIVMHRVDPSKLQFLAVQFSEKAAMFVENNERLLDSKTGGYGYKFDNKPPENWGNQGYNKNYNRKRTYNRNPDQQFYQKPTNYFQNVNNYQNKQNSYRQQVRTY